MYDNIKYDGRKELQKCIARLPHRPTNTEIAEKTKSSRGGVSDIMSGKREPTEKFIDKFKRGFNLNDTIEVKTLEDYHKIINENIQLKSNVSLLKETVKDLIEALSKKQ